MLSLAAIRSDQSEHLGQFLLLHDLLGPPKTRDIPGGEGVASHGCTGRTGFHLTSTYGTRLVTLHSTGVMGGQECRPRGAGGNSALRQGRWLEILLLPGVRLCSSRNKEGSPVSHVSSHRSPEEDSQCWNQQSLGSPHPSTAGKANHAVTRTPRRAQGWNTE